MNIDDYKQIKVSIDELLSLISKEYRNIDMNLDMYETLVKLGSTEPVDILLLENSLSHIFYSIEYFKSLDTKVRCMISLLKGDSYDSKSN